MVLLDDVVEILDPTNHHRYVHASIDFIDCRFAGKTVDFLLTAKRDKAAAMRFFDKAMQANEVLEKVTIGKSGANNRHLHLTRTNDDPNAQSARRLGCERRYAGQSRGFKHNQMRLGLRLKSLSEKAGRQLIGNGLRGL